MSEFHYKAWEVDKETYDAYELGTTYCDGEVVDGVCEHERNAHLIIITRHEGTPMDWEAAYRELRGIIETFYAWNELAAEQLQLHIGRRDQLLQHGRRAALEHLMLRMHEDGAIHFTRQNRESTGAVRLGAYILVVRDRERLMQLPDTTQEERDGQEV